MHLGAMILRETGDFVVLDKPSGLLSIPDREGKEVSLKQLLQKRYGTIFTVHRLDKETSGLIVFAKNEQAHRQLSQQFATSSVNDDRDTRKIYRGLVIGSLPERTGRIEARLAEHPVMKGTMVVHRKGREAITDYSVQQDFGAFSYVEFRLVTGRTHQIRVHMKEVGHPLVCDRIYGDGKPLLVSSLKARYKLSKDLEEEKPLLNRLALHAFQLSFKDPGGETIFVEAPLPKDMRAALQQLSKWNKKR